MFILRLLLTAAVAAASLAGSVGENSAAPLPLYVWSSHEGPAQVNLTNAKLLPFGNDFAVWNFRRQLSVSDVQCNVIYLLGEIGGVHCKLQALLPLLLQAKTALSDTKTLELT